MTKDYCDICKTDITMDTKYVIGIRKLSDNLGEPKKAFRDHMICGHCKVWITGSIHDRTRSDT